MNRNINKIKLFVNDNDRAKEIAHQIEKELIKYNFEITEKNYDLGISVGGDGSFLRMVKQTEFDETIKYIGVHAGTLGFLQDIDINNLPDFVKRLNNNEYKVEKINIEETIITTKDKIYSLDTLNEVVIRDLEFNTAKLKVRIDDELLENYKGDGLLISTSTGSTAYNMSFGGSIVYNTIPTLQITPIAPLKNRLNHNLINSIIISKDSKITIYPEKESKDIIVIADGVNHYIKDVEKIEIKIKNKQIKFLRMNDFHFIKVVKNKILQEEK